MEILNPSDPSVWTNTTVNSATASLPALSPPIRCVTPAIQVCRVYMTLPTADFQVLGATLVNINEADACALSTNDPNGFFFYQGDSNNQFPKRDLYVAGPRNRWNAQTDTSVGDALCGTYMTVASAPENNVAHCALSFPSPSFAADGTMAPGVAWFCFPDAANAIITPGGAPIPPNGPLRSDNTILLAQFTVRAGYQVHGSLSVRARAFPSTTTQDLAATVAFQCFC